MDVDTNCVRPLRSLCVESIVRNLCFDMKTCKNYRFDLESSDQILHELLSKHYITTDIAREVSEKFNARKVVLPKLIVMDVKNMLLTQNFRSFSIPHPESYQFLKSMHDQASIKGDDTRHGEMDLPSALTLMLNKNSRNGLHTLSATGFSIAHPRGWVSRLAEILPSLTSLTIPYCKLTTTDFTILCNEFQNLKTLDVSQTRLTNLSGIEKLQSLESLNLSGLFFDTEVDLECLFELMKLRVLFIRSTPETNSFTLNQFLQIGRVLHSLRVLDCSFNYITEEDLQKLTMSHTSLEKICIFGSPLTDTLLPPFSNINLVILSSRTLRDKLNTVHFYTQNRMIQTWELVDIIEVIFVVMATQLENVTKEDLYPVFMKMIEILEDYRTDSNIIICVTGTLDFICRKTAFIEKLPVAVNQRLIDVVLHGWYSLAMLTNDQKWEIIPYIWNILCHKSIHSSASASQRYAICSAAAEALVNIDVLFTVPYECARTFSKVIGKLTVAELTRLTQYSSLMDVSLGYVRTCENLEAFLEYYNIFRCLYHCATVPVEEWSTIIRILMEKMKRFTRYPHAQLIILRGLYGENYQLMNSIHRDSYCTFFETLGAEVFEQLFSTKNEELLYATASLLANIWVNYFSWYQDFQRDDVGSLVITLCQLFRAHDSSNRSFENFLVVNASKGSRDCPLLKPWAEWVHRQYITRFM